jgi:hypothetical protein
MNLKFLNELGRLKISLLFIVLVLTTQITSSDAPADPAPPANADTPANTDAQPGAGGDKMDTDDGKKESTADVELEPEMCNTELVRSYGLQGRVKPSLAPLEMCPTIKRNCCRAKDQLGMYASWVYGGQERLIDDRFKHIQRVYMKYLNVANKIKNRAAEMLEKNRLQKISNCNIMASRIVKFEVDELITQVRENLNSMKKFFKTAFKGFYCGVCNFDNHKYFDLETKILKVDDNFCYWTVSHSLRVLLFFYQDIVSYSNLMSQFVKSCSAEGVYSFGEQISPLVIFTDNEELNKNLVRCKDNIETNKWLPHCRFICDKFSVVGLSGFFEPNLDQIEFYGKWLKAVYDEKVIEETQPFDIRSIHKKKKSLSDLLVESAGPVVADVMKEVKENTKDPNAKPEEAKKGDDKKGDDKKADDKKGDAKPEAKPQQSLRVLESKPAEKGGDDSKPKDEKKPEGDKPADAKAGEAGAGAEAKPEAEGVIRKELVVFRNDLEGKFPLEEFVYEYLDEGVDFFVEGKNTLFEHEVYMQIKALLHLGKLVKNKANMLNIFDKHFGRHFWCGITRLSTLILSGALLSLVLKF